MSSSLQAAFPPTAWSRIAAGPDSEALERLCRAYWRPIYWYVRRAWNKTSEDAADLTQAFFLDMLNREAFHRADKSRGRFRTFLRASIDNFLRKDHRAALALARGGGRLPAPLDQEALELPDPTVGPAVDLFDSLWAVHMLEESVELLLERLQELDPLGGAVFEAHYLAAQRPSLAALARRLAVSESAARRALVRARRAWIGVVRARLLDTLTRPEDVEEELRLLFGDRLEE